MPTAPPGWQRCGTNSTGWLATPHPPVGAAPRSSIVCFHTGRESSLYCSATAEAEVCACSYDGVSETYTYRLIQPWACPAAYCGTDDDMLQSPILPILRERPSMKVECADASHSTMVSYNGYNYRTLHGAPKDGSQAYTSEGQVWGPMPEGFEVSPDSATDSSAGSGCGDRRPLKDGWPSRAA